MDTPRDFDVPQAVARIKEHPKLLLALVEHGRLLESNRRGDGKHYAKLITAQSHSDIVLKPWQQDLVARYLVEKVFPKTTGRKRR